LLGAKRVCPDLLWYDSITTTTTTTLMIFDQCAIISEEALARLNHHPPVAPCKMNGLCFYSHTNDNIVTSVKCFKC
jgi:hypothetical protein